MTEGTARRGRYSLMALTVAQVEAVSKEVGLPSSRWDEADSWVVMACIYAVVEAVPFKDAKALTIRQLVDRMTIDGGYDEPEEDPQTASG
jgi:hypothetical protein